MKNTKYNFEIYERSTSTDFTNILPEDYSWLKNLNLTDDDLRYLIGLTSAESTVPNPTLCYCNGTMRSIALEYRNIHGYLSLLVCIFGTLANLLNVVVLTRKQMKNAPFAYILTWLAGTDMLLMAEYIPFVFYMYIGTDSKVERFSYTGAVYILFHTHLSQVLHTISICLTLTLAFWRNNAVRYPEKCDTLWTKEKCAKAVKIALFLPIIICSPSYFMFSVQSTKVYENREFVRLYYLDLSDLAKSYSELLYIANLWLYAVVIKLLPCIILVLISTALIQALKGTTERKERLQKAHDPRRNVKLQRVRRRADRSSHMLIAILCLFLITEIPQCILGLLSGILGRCFFRNCYHLFGEIMDILALINGAINFILYCVMSKQFRNTFGLLFHVGVKRNGKEFHI